MQPRRHEGTKKNAEMFSFVSSCLGGCLFVVTVAWPALAQSSGKPVTFKGLEISVAGVERAPSASLKDCPPGDNRVNAMTRPGEEFAVVTVKFKVLPAFQPNTMLKKPTLTDSAGKTYNTAVSFVDVGSVPEFSCAIPFRVPTGTALKSVQIDSTSLDLAGADTKK
jgi:hypothetical protein